MSAGLLKSLLSEAGITINGPNQWDIHVHNEKFYSRIWREKSLGLGEAYMDGWWDCERQVVMTSEESGRAQPPPLPHGVRRCHKA